MDTSLPSPEPAAPSLHQRTDSSDLQRDCPSPSPQAHPKTPSPQHTTAGTAPDPNGSISINTTTTTATSTTGTGGGVMSLAAAAAAAAAAATTPTLITTPTVTPTPTPTSTAEAWPLVGNRPRSASTTKALLSMALLEAQSAVQLDNESNIAAAVESYGKAVTLLGKVMEATSAPEERERLKIIHDSYRFRMHLLATPPIPSADTDEQGQDDKAGEARGVSSQDFPSFMLQAQIPVQARSSLPPTPMSPPPDQARSHPLPPPGSPPPRSPSAMSPRSPPTHRTIRSPALGPQMPRSPPLSAVKNMHNINNLSNITTNNNNNNNNNNHSYAGVAQQQHQAMPLYDRPSSPRDASPNRTKKGAVSHGPLSPLSPADARPRRPRAESASATEGVQDDVNGTGLANGRGRFRTRTHTDSISVPRPPAGESPFHSPDQTQPRRASAAQPRIREREALPKVVILQTPPTAPLPAPPQWQGEIASEPVLSSSSPVVSVPTMISAPSAMQTLESVPEVPPPVQSGPSTPLSPSGLLRRADRSRALSPPPRPTSPPPRPTSPPPRPSSPPQRPPRPSSPTLVATHHMIMATLAGPSVPIPERPLSPPPSMALPFAPPRVSSPTLSPTSPTRRGKPQIPAGLQYKKLDIQDLIPNRDQSLQAQSEILHRQGQGEGQDAQREQTEEEQGEHKQRLQQTGDEQESAATSESTQDTDNGSAVEETGNNNGAADSSGAIPEELSQEWLPSLLSKSFATSKIFLDNLAVPQDPIPRERVFLKGWYHPSQTDEPGSPQNLNIIVNSSTSVPEEDEQNSETTKVSSPVQHSPSSATANALRQQPLASSSSTSLASSLSSSSSTKTRVSLSMPIFIPGASSGAGSENKNRNSGSAQNRRSQELSSPVDNQRNPYNNNGKGRPSTSQINNSGGYSTSRDVTLQDIIAQDPFSGMKPPLPDPNIEPAPADPFLRCFWFMHLLEQTMTTGGFLSPKLYVPKMIWYQKAMIRLPAIDAKIYTCQTISQVLERLTAQSKSGKLSLLVKMDKDVEKAERERNRVLNELEALETMTVEHWTRLAKKMSFINRPGKLSGSGGGGVGWAGSGSGSQLYHQGQSSRPPHHYEYQNPHFQPQQRMLQLYQEESALGPYDWIGSDDPFSSLATASLQSATMSSGALSSGALSTGQMTSSNLTSSSLSEKAGAGGAGNKRTTTEIKNQWKSFSKSVQKTMVNEKIEDTTEYTEALVKLFQSSFVLEDMIKHFGSLPPHQTHIKILNKLQRICDFYNLVVCAFVIRDLGELMVKYVKRMGSLVAE